MGLSSRPGLDTMFLWSEFSRFTHRDFLLGKIRLPLWRVWTSKSKIKCVNQNYAIQSLCLLTMAKERNSFEISLPVNRSECLAANNFFLNFSFTQHFGLVRTTFSSAPTLKTPFCQAIQRSWFHRLRWCQVSLVLANDRVCRIGENPPKNSSHLLLSKLATKTAEFFFWTFCALLSEL